MQTSLKGQKFFYLPDFPLSLDEANQALKESGFSNLDGVSAVQALPEIPIMGTGKTNFELEATLAKKGILVYVIINLEPLAKHLV